MKLLFKCTDPDRLKSSILKMIDDEELKTWSVIEDDNVKYLKHTQQWGDKGVIKLTVNSEKKILTAQVYKFKKVEENVKDFEGYYLGRFCELVFVNFQADFTSIERG